MRLREWFRAVLTAVAVAAMAWGCAGRGGQTTRGSSDVLTAAEIEPMASRDLLTVIERLRPRWVHQARLVVTTSGPQPVTVIVDGLRQEGSIEVLRGYAAADVEEVQFLDARDATTRYGLDMMSGALVVTLKR